MRGFPRPFRRPLRCALLPPVAVGALAIAGCAVTRADDAGPVVETVPSVAPGDVATTATAPAPSGSPTSTALPATTTIRPATTSTATTTPVPTSTSSTAPAATTSTAVTTTSIPAAPSLPPVSSVPVVAGPLDLGADIVGLGYSAEGRPIFAERYGSPGGRRVLVIGVIHGDEDDGLAIIDELRRRAAPDGVELWLVDSMNPDGVANQDRHNGNEVDLNRNFPYKWGPIGQPGDSQYAGTGPASEPETQAVVNFIEQLRPDITIWYHQDLFVINPSTGREGRIRARYAELTGLPLGEITGGTYTGIAATWARNALAGIDAVAFIVELDATLSVAEAMVHADAVLTIAAEG